MKAFGIVMDKVFCAPNTIEVSNSFDCSEHPKKSFLFVGRAQARKRVDLLLQSFSETRAMLPSGASVDIVGVGAENVRLREIAVQLGIEKHVRFHGEIHDSNRLRDLFKEAFAYVSPGPVGLGVLHSFAYGVPVVTKRQGKHGPEFGRLKDGVNSVIFDGDEDLSQTLIDLATVPGLSQRLGHAAFCDFLNEGQLSTMVDGFNAAIQRSIEVKVL